MTRLHNVTLLVKRSSEFIGFADKSAYHFNKDCFASVKNDIQLVDPCEPALSGSIKANLPTTVILIL